MFVALIMGASSIQAADATGAGDKYINPAGNPVDQLTGEYWMKSSPEIKEAFLFGIDNAITVNAIIARRQADQKNGYRLSKFDEDWMKAFRNTTRKEVVKELDAWYAAHPQDEKRSVLSVIWHEMIVPRVGK